MGEVVKRCCGKDVSDFKKGQIMGLHHSKKTTKEIAEITRIGLRSDQFIIKTSKDGDELSTSRNKCGRKKLLSSWDQRSLKRLVKKNRTKSTLELTAIFNMGHRAYQHAQKGRSKIQSVDRIIGDRAFAGDEELKARIKHTLCAITEHLARTRISCRHSLSYQGGTS
ncbi:hypothetical protein AVEN_142892-1 [Araneus ventricosus]|uniref:Uncharacterized protein n=1 Tax=Araneus ventricosus TaxID=182803 RepID=A0A4Y2LUN0_ARAVE|nr:hypothetical protein AVEN_142892-1 [Araneus ventricosus]